MHFFYNSILMLIFLPLEHHWKMLSYWSTIGFIIYWNFSMIYQIFFSPQVKRWAVNTYKHGIFGIGGINANPRLLHRTRRPAPAPTPNNPEADCTRRPEKDPPPQHPSPPPPPGKKAEATSTPISCRHPRTPNPPPHQHAQTNSPPTPKRRRLCDPHF